LASVVLLCYDKENFGFDLERGITQVALDLNTPHYWLEVRKRAS